MSRRLGKGRGSASGFLRSSLERSCAMGFSSSEFTLIKLAALLLLSVWEEKSLRE